MVDIERRAQQHTVALRAAPDGSNSLGVLVGTAIAYNKLSRDLGGWFEEIAPGSANLDNRVLARWNHDSNGLLGTTDAGSLRLIDRDETLDYEIDLPDTTHGRDIAYLAERGDIAFSSFAFRLIPGGVEWRYGPNDELIRRVTALSLVDVAPVADPAYWDSSATLARSLDLGAIKASIRSDTAPTSTPDWVRYRKQLGAQPAHQ